MQAATASDPWAFGWTQLLTLVGFIITIVIAIGGFRTFNRWKREKLEESRIAIALEALSIAYESKFVFEMIRNPGTFGHEWADMPTWEGEDEATRQARGPYYAILKRLENNADFFARVWKLQPRFMAVFGPETEKIFTRLHAAHAHIQVSARMLMRRRADGGREWSEAQQERESRMEADIWGVSEEDENYDRDRVGRDLAAFRKGIIDLCRPVVDEQYRPGGYVVVKQR